MFHSIEYYKISLRKGEKISGEQGNWQTIANR